MVISPTASWIRRCMRGDLMWTCLVWAERPTLDNFWVPSHRFNSATGEQKGITQTIYTDSESPSRMPKSLMPSAKLRSASLLFLRLWCDGIEPRPPTPRADALTTRLPGGGSGLLESHTEISDMSEKPRQCLSSLIYILNTLHDRFGNALNRQCYVLPGYI